MIRLRWFFIGVGIGTIGVRRLSKPASRAAAGILVRPSSRWAQRLKLDLLTALRAGAKESSRGNQAFAELAAARNRRRGGD